MKLAMTLTIVAVLAACSSEPAAPAALTAKADLLDNAGKSIGTATLTETEAGVRIVLDVKGLTPGAHAFHIHNNGSCHAAEAKPFDSAGPHFNPFGKKHGTENPDGPHAGDLPNFEAKADGTAHFEVVARLVTLKEGPNNSLLKTGGTCLMIHEKADDNKSDPAGNAGTRWACGLITK
jgi:Cu-Zn family superoxide dismutase